MQQKAVLLILLHEPVCQ